MMGMAPRDLEKAKLGLGSNFARLDGGKIKKRFRLRKYGTF